MSNTYDRPYNKPSSFEIDFMDYLIENNIKRQEILHFGPGDHHFLGKTNYEMKLFNNIKTIGYSPTEYQGYINLINETPEIMAHYLMLYIDLYMVHYWGPIFKADYVTLFHLCEYSENSRHNTPEQYGQELEVDFIKWTLPCYFRKNKNTKFILAQKSNHYQEAAKLMEESKMYKKVSEYKGLDFYAMHCD